MPVTKTSVANLIVPMRSAMQDLVTVVMNSDTEFQDLLARASSLPGLLQRLEDLKSRHKEYTFDDVNDFDDIGTELWNGTAILRKRAGNTLDKPLGQLRYMACLMIEIGSTNDKQSRFRIFQTFLKTANYYSKANELAEKAIVRCADFQNADFLAKYPISVDDEPLQSQLMAEYYLSRIRLSWLQNQLQFADFMYQSLVQIHLPPRQCQKLLLQIAEILFDIGTDQLQHKSLDGAVKYLRWSWDYINQIIRVEGLSVDGRELSANIRHNLAKALIGREGRQEMDLERARELVEGLALDAPKEYWMYHLKMEYLEKSGASIEAIFASLATMIELVELTEETFNNVIAKIHALDKDSQSAKHCIDCLNSLIRRLLGLENSDWLEKALVTRVFLVGKYPPAHNPDGVKALRRVLDDVRRGAPAPLSSKAACSIQMLLWRISDTYFAKGQLEECLSWANLAYHEVIRQFNSNDAKILRRITRCLIDLERAGEARDQLDQISETPPHALTCVLQFQVALASDSEEMAMSALQRITTATGFAPQMLYLCALEAQEKGKKELGCEVLKKIVRDWDETWMTEQAKDEIRLPTIFRCIIRFTYSETDEGRTTDSSIITVLCGQFEAAAKKAEEIRRKVRDDNRGNVFSLKELDWFSQNAYNCAVGGCESWENNQIVSITESCLKFLMMYPNDMDLESRRTVFIRKLVCWYLACSALTYAARKEMHIETRRSAYSAAAKYALVFRQHMKSLDNPLEESVKKEMNAKYSFLLLVTFEGAVRLQEWASLKSILQEASTVPVSLRVLECMADIVLCGEDAIPDDVRLETMQDLLNAIILVPERTKPLISRWVRVVIELSLQHSDATTAGLMPQLMQMLRNDEVRGVEAHWIAATLWNKALDHLGAGDQISCNTWCQHAISASRFVGDEGSLEQTVVPLVYTNCEMQDGYNDILARRTRGL